MSSVVQPGYMYAVGSIEYQSNVMNWAEDIGITISIRDNAVNPNTFEPSWTWIFETEEHKTMFLLKWRNT